MEFLVDSVNSENWLLGRNAGKADIPLGVIFTNIKVKAVKQEMTSQKIEPNIKIKLILKEVIFYNRKFEIIPGGIQQLFD